jgi:hypothetical protein
VKKHRFLSVVLGESSQEDTRGIQLLRKKKDVLIRAETQVREGACHTCPHMASFVEQIVNLKWEPERKPIL